MNINTTKIKIVAFDLDGTINYGDTLIDGADSAVQLARNLGIKVIFLTNNSTKSRNELWERLTRLGINCELDDIYSSGYGAALYAKKHNFTNVYVCGSKSLISEFEQMEISLRTDSNAEYMVIGHNPEFTYETLANCIGAAIHVKKMIACNKDRTYPGNNGVILPGSGAMVSAIEWCAGRVVDTIIGKPDTILLNLILHKYQVKPEELLVVGDTYESDIAMAKHAGCPSILISKNKYADTQCINSINEISTILPKISL